MSDNGDWRDLPPVPVPRDAWSGPDDPWADESWGDPVPASASPAAVPPQTRFGSGPNATRHKAIFVAAAAILAVMAYVAMKPDAEAGLATGPRPTASSATTGPGAPGPGAKTPVPGPKASVPAVSVPDAHEHDEIEMDPADADRSSAAASAAVLAWATQSGDEPVAQRRARLASLFSNPQRIPTAPGIGGQPLGPGEKVQPSMSFVEAAEATGQRAVYVVGVQLLATAESDGNRVEVRRNEAYETVVVKTAQGWRAETIRAAS